MISSLVLASHNPGKLREIAGLLAPLGVQVVAASHVGVDEPEETGQSFAENARIKAIYSTERTGKAALSDDSGLVVPALDGAPGIYSARWAGPSKDFGLACQKIADALEKKGREPSGQKAFFVCALALSLPSGVVEIFQGEVHGHLCFPPRGEAGFGYDPIFIPEGKTQSFGEMAAEEKHRLSHRARAFQALMESSLWQKAA